MATATTLLSLEEYLQTSYHLDCDFVEGRLEERHVGERDHNRTQLLLGGWFLAHEEAWNIYVLPEQRTRVSFVKVRTPDLCLLRGDAPNEQVLLTPPHPSSASKSSRPKIVFHVSRASWTITLPWAYRTCGLLTRKNALPIFTPKMVY